MQIAGSRCVVCTQNVGIVRDGIACTKCGVVYHRACLKSSGCPNCGESLMGGEEAHSLPSPAQQIEMERPTSVTVIGRVTYLGGPMSVLMVLVGFLQLASDFAVGIGTILTGLFTGLLSVVLGSAFLSGREWARGFYLWVTPLILAVEIVVGDNGIIESGFSWWRSAIWMGTYCAFAFALTRPKTSTFFKRATR